MHLIYSTFFEILNSHAKFSFNQFREIANSSITENSIFITLYCQYCQTYSNLHSIM